MKKLGTNELLIRRETVKVICMHCDHDFMVNKSLLPDGLGSTKKKMSNFINFENSVLYAFFICAMYLALERSLTRSTQGE